MSSNYLFSNITLQFTQLACRLLRAGIVLCSMACVVPSQLEPEPAEPPRHPAFVTESTQPPFGPISVTTPGQQFDLHFFAETDAANPTLYVRLFLPNPGPMPGQLFNGTNITVTLTSDPNNSDPNGRFLRSGEASNLFSPCAYGHGLVTIYAVVADQKFNDNIGAGSQTQMSPGLTQANHWEFNCP